MFRTLDQFFENRLRFIRRIAGICLIAMGVHEAADWLDNLVYLAIDGMDRICDLTITSALNTFTEWGALDPQVAARWSGAFSDWLGIEEKETFSKGTALFVELGIDLALLDHLWGTRSLKSASSTSWHLRNDFRDAYEAIRTTMPYINLRLFLIGPVFLVLAIAGANRVAKALETQISSSLSGHGFIQWAPFMASFSALLFMGVLAYKFLPSLLTGALKREHELFVAQYGSPQGGLEFTDPSLRRKYTRKVLLDVLWGLCFCVGAFQAATAPQGVLSLVQRALVSL